MFPLFALIAVNQTYPDNRDSSIHFLRYLLRSKFTGKDRGDSPSQAVSPRKDRTYRLQIFVTKKSIHVKLQARH